MNDLKIMDETELKQYDVSEGYTYKYSPDMPEIKIVARGKNIFEVIDFQNTKTTFAAHAVYLLMCQYDVTEIYLRFHGYDCHKIPIGKNKDSSLDIRVFKELSHIYSQLEAIDSCDIRNW